MSSFSGIKSLLSDSLIYGISDALSRMLSIFLVPLYTAVLLPSDYGIMGLITSGYSLLLLVVNLNLDNSAARWFYDTDDVYDRKFTISTWLWFYLGAALGISIILLFFSDDIACILLDDVNIGFLVKIVAVTIPLSTCSTVLMKLFRFERKPKRVMAFSLFQSLLMIALNCYLVLYLREGLQGIYLSQLVTFLITFFISIYLLRKWLISPFKMSWQRLKEMLKFSLPLFPASIAYWTINLSGLFFLNKYCDKSEVGLYQIGTSFASAVALITGAFQSAWGPFAYSIYKKEDSGRIFSQVANLYIVGIGFICMLLGVFAFDVLRIFTNSNYYAASWVIAILAYNYFFIGLSYIASLGAGIAKNNKAYGMIMLVSACLLICLNVILVPIYGKVGSAIATCISQAVIPVYMFYKSQKLYFIPYKLTKSIVVFIILVVLMCIGGNIYLSNWWVQIGYKVIIAICGVFIIGKAYPIIFINILKAGNLFK